VDLETNHRCAPEIVHRAARLVAHNVERFEKRIRPSKAASGQVTLLADSGDEVARARWLLATWAMSGTSATPERRAVLARTNRELAPYAAVALELGLPYRVESDGLLLDDPGLLEAIDHAVDRAHAGQPVLLALRSAAAETGLDAASTSALLGWAAAFGDLATLRSRFVALKAARHDPAGDAALTLATIHGTKGLEWDHVACIGHDDGTFPSGRALTEAPEPARALEEERRLAYVAWTRARKTLTIVYDPGAPSVFLREAFEPSELVAPSTG
jgi:DNA helicase-2/ATP-dependent DNA helicase PcrA